MIRRSLRSLRRAIAGSPASASPVTVDITTAPGEADRGPGPAAPLPSRDEVVSAFDRTVQRAAAADVPGLGATIEHWSDPVRVTNYERVYRQGLAERVPGFVGSVGLDFGCWNGFAAHLMQRLGAERVVGVDVVPHVLAQGRGWITALDERRLSLVTADVSDGFSVPLPSDTYDWISVGQVYCALNPGLIDTVLDEMVRLLRPGGTLYLNDSNNPHVPAVRQRLLDMYHRHEIGEGTPDDPRGAGREVRATLIAASHPDLDPDDVSMLATETAYLWRPEILAAVDRWRADRTRPGSRFEPGVLRAVVHADIGIAATNPTDPLEIAAAFSARGLTCTIATSPGGPDLSDDPDERAEMLAAHAGFHLHATKPAEPPVAVPSVPVPPGPTPDGASPIPVPSSGRSLRFPPYRSADDTTTPAEEVLRQRHLATCLCFGPDYAAGPGIDKVPSADFDDFRFLLDELVAMADEQGFVFRRLRDVRPDHEEPDGRIPVLFKHDIDNDIELALRMAEAQHERGIPATYYVLHGAPYHGRWDADGVYHRFTAMMPLYRRLQELGHEVGLHFNPYDLYRDRRIDGAAAIRTELAEMRAAGLDITGAFGHSSAARQGVESIEIFEEHLQHEPEMVRPESARRESVFVHGDVPQPRLILSGRALGLDVFGEFMTRSIGRYSYWSMQCAERWLAAENPALPRPDDLVGTASMLRWIRQQGTAPFHIINIHPLAYGLRAGRTADEERELRASAAAAPTRSPGPGEGRYEPGSMVVAPGDAPDGSPQAGRVVMGPANELGCLDHPLEPHRGRPGVVLIGGDRLEARDVQLHASVGGWLRDRLRRAGRGDLTTRVLACADPPTGFVTAALERAETYGPVAAVVLLRDAALETAEGGADAWASREARLAARHRLIVVDAEDAASDAATPGVHRIDLAATLAAAGVRPTPRLSADGSEHLARAIHAALADLPRLP